MQAVVAVVGQRDALLLVVEGDDRRPPGRRSPPGPPACRSCSPRGASGRRRSPSSYGGPFAARDHPRALLPAQFDVRLDPVPVGRRDHRADHRALRRRVADLHDGQRSRSASRPAGRRRRAARAPASAPYRSGRCRRRTSCRCPPPPSPRPRRRRRAPRPCRPAPSAGASSPRPHTSAMRCPTAVEPVKLTMSTSGESTAASPTSGARPGDHVHDARRRARLRQGLGHPVDGQRVLRGGLHDHRVAHRERGRDLAGRVGPRVVVRGDAGDDADRAGVRRARPKTPAFPIGPASLICGGQRPLHRLQRALRVPPEAGRAHRRPACRARCRSVAPLSAWASAAYGSRLALDDVGGRGPGSRPAPPASCATRRPKASRAAAAAAYTCSRRASGREPDDLLGRRVDHLVVAAVRLDPLAADEQPLPRCGSLACSPSSCPGPSAAPCPAPRPSPRRRGSSRRR